MKRHLLLLVIMMCVARVAWSQFTINQLPVVQDGRTGDFLCSIPVEAFDQPFVATIALQEGQWDKMLIDTTEVAPVATYTFADVDSAHVFPITAITGTDTLHYNIAFTWHPIVLLNSLDGEFNVDYKPSTVVFIAPGEAASLPLTSRTKWRGNTTVRYEREKRNYRIKFVDDEGNKVDMKFFPDLRSDNNWLLDAGQVDNARIRNKAGMDLWMDMVCPMWYADREPKAINGARSHIVEVFLDGNYHGFYSMGEAIDRKQLKLKKYDEDTQTFHGQLWKSVAWNDYTLMAKEVPEKKRTSLEYAYGYEVKYPDIEDVSPTDVEILYSAINFVVKSSDEEFREHVAEYFDIPILKYYEILYQLLLAWDNGGKNLYWAVYDKAIDRRMELVAWDFDATVGQDYINRKDIDWDKISPERNLKLNHRLFARLNSLNVDDYPADVRRIYYRLRKTILQEDSLIARYTGLIEKVQHSGAAQRETVRWHNVVDLYYRDLDFDHQKEYIADWWHRRLAFLDKNVFNIEPVRGDVNRDFVVDIDDVNAVLNVMVRKTPYDADADLDGSGVVDIDDLNSIINIIVHKAE